MEIYPWATIEAEYVATDTTAEKLAQKYGCSVSALRKKCTAGEWRRKRQEAKQRATAAAVEGYQEAARKEMWALVGVASKVSGRIQTLVAQTEDPLSAKDLRSVAGALSSIADVLRVAGRIPTVAEEASQRAGIDRLELERQRLELERQRLELVKAQGVDGGAEIVVDGEAVDYAD